MSKGTVVGLPQNKSLIPINDPLQVNSRLYHQVSELLKQLETGEHITIRERFQAMTAIARIQYVFVTLRKEKVAHVDAGSSVRKYAKEFEQTAALGRKNNSRRAAPEPEPEPDPDAGWIDRGTDDPFPKDPFAGDDDGA